MRNIRFGKDITTRWRIKTNGEHESLLGRDLHLILTDQFGNKSELPFVISDTNLVTFVWFGKDHKRYGHHIITLFENFGVEGQTAVDAVDYVNLVEYTTQENNATYDNLSMETVELEGDIATSGRGLNNYELWILDGHQGSLADYLQWARGDKGDPGEDGKPLTWDDLTDEQKESLRGRPGADGADAKINGVNTVRIIQGKNMQINQSGSTMTFDSIPDPASILRTHLAYDVQESLKKADDVDKKADKTALDTLSAKIGNLSNLSTNDRTNLVNAINEIASTSPKLYKTAVRASVSDDIFNSLHPWAEIVADNRDGHGSIVLFNDYTRYQEYLYGNIKVDEFGLYMLTFYTFRGGAMEVATAVYDFEEQRIEPISHDTFSISSINATLAQKADKSFVTTLVDNTRQDFRVDISMLSDAISHKYSKPSTGIPESDLSQDVKDKLNAGGSSVNVVDNLASDSATDALSAKQGKALKSLVDGKATDTAVLHKTGDESASGKKTFEDGIQAPIVEVGEGTAVATISPILGLDGNTGFMFAGKKGNAELAGVGTPTTSSSATNKKYVDDALANKASSSDLASLSSKIGNLETSKQDTIADLATIRSGAARGATALQSHQPLKTINGQAISGSGDIVIPKGDKGDKGAAGTSFTGAVPMYDETGESLTGTMTQHAITKGLSDITEVADASKADIVESGIITLTGAVTSSGSWSRYLFYNKSFSRIKVTAYTDSNYMAIAFYNDTVISASAFMQAESVVGTKYTSSYDVAIPEGCKLIVVCNRTASRPLPDITLSLSGMAYLYNKSFDQDLAMKNLKLVATLDNYDKIEEGCQIYYSNGAKTSAPNKSIYYFRNFNYKKVEVTTSANTSTFAAIAFYRTDEPIIDGYIAENSVPCINSGGPTYSAEVPDDCKLIVVANNLQYGFYLYVNIWLEDMTSISKRFDYIKGRLGEMDDIVELNDSRKTLEAFKLLSKPTYIGETTTGQETLSFVHFSDIHGSEENTKRIVQFANHYREFIKDVYCSGDLVPNLMTSGFDYWQTAQANDIMFCTGNHEVRTSTGWDATQAQVHDAFFASYMQGWANKGAILPSNALANKVNYYYKDYFYTNANKTKNGLRVIVLDAMFPTSEQDAWFAETLANAASANLAVICMEHFVPDGRNATKIASRFSCKGGIGAFDSHFTASANALQRWQGLVDNSGVEFVCWLCGHIHNDWLGYCNDYPNQLFIAVNVASYVSVQSAGSETLREPGEKTMDCFNVLSVDTYSKLIRVMRIGADRDRHLRGKRTFCYDYGNHELFSEE